MAHALKGGKFFAKIFDDDGSVLLLHSEDSRTSLKKGEIAPMFFEEILLHP